MKIAYCDCFSGASGDMILGALVAAGWPQDELERTIAALGVQGYRTIVQRVNKQGFAAHQVSFELSRPHAHRPLGELLDTLANGNLPRPLKADAARVLRRLGRAEASVHGLEQPAESVDLHELGSLDTLFDVVGAVAGFRALGIRELHVSPVNLGGGTVKSAHGLLPVPAPAVADLVKGMPVFGGSATDGELLTPTGAAILATMATKFGSLPAMVVERVGLGAGIKDAELPNVLRLWVGEADNSADRDQVCLIEANIDDMNPEFYGPLFERLLAAGALDVFLSPVIMKKGRPGILLSLICPPDKSTDLGDAVFEETTTLGLRYSVVERRKLQRNVKVVNTAFGAIRVKTGLRGGAVITVAPEFEDCGRAASKAKVPVKVVYEAALAAYRSSEPEG